MEPIFYFIFQFKYGIPILFFMVVCLNAFLLKLKVKGYIQKDPSLENGYNLLIAGVITAYSLPFMALLIALIFGKYNTFGDVVDDMMINMLTPDRNPLMLIFLAIEFVEFALFLFWVGFLGGEAFIAKHPGVIRFGRRISRKPRE
jgi:hypothetical protein